MNQGIFEFEGYRPVIHEGAFVHPSAVIIGNVIIGDRVYIGPGAVVRGDFGQILIEDGCNVQENCVIHMFPGVTVQLMAGAHIGHGAIIHGATIGKDCLVGMNAVIMDRTVINDECIIGALTLVPADSVILARSVAVGNPFKIVKEVSDEMLLWKKEGTSIYQGLPQRLKDSLRNCEPLRSIPADLKIQQGGYKTWNETRK